MERQGGEIEIGDGETKRRNRENRLRDKEKK